MRERQSTAANRNLWLQVTPIVHLPLRQRNPNTHRGTHRLQITDIDGPTILFDYDGVRFLTAPTFDSTGGDYKSGAVTGFVLFNVDSPKRVIDLSGDTVLFAGVAEVAKLARLFQTTT